MAIISIFNRSSTGKGFRSGIEREETPVEILKKRYARGEITEDEYKYMKDKLRE